MLYINHPTNAYSVDDCGIEYSIDQSQGNCSIYANCEEHLRDNLIEDFFGNRMYVMRIVQRHLAVSVNEEITCNVVAVESEEISDRQGKA
jgi:hypothetical protein